MDFNEYLARVRQAEGCTAVPIRKSSIVPCLFPGYAVFPSEDDSKEISIGTVSSLSAAAVVEVCSGPAMASTTVQPDALQGVPLSDQEREDIEPHRLDPGNG